MRERPIRFAVRVLIGLAACALIGAQWQAGDTMQAVRGFMLVGAYAVYVAVVMRIEAREDR